MRARWAKEFPVELMSQVKLDCPPTFTGFHRDITERSAREKADARFG